MSIEDDSLILYTSSKIEKLEQAWWEAKMFKTLKKDIKDLNILEVFEMKDEDLISQIETFTKKIELELKSFTS